MAHATTTLKIAGGGGAGEPRPATRRASSKREQAGQDRNPGLASRTSGLASTHCTQARQTKTKQSEGAGDGDFGDFAD